MLKRMAAKLMEQLTTALLPQLFERSFFQTALYQYLTTVQAKQAPSLFVDPLECIGASILVSQKFYESTSLQAVKNHLSQWPPKRLFYVDVGANLGNHLVAFSDLYEEALGLEPIDFNHLLCQANLIYNNLATKASAHQIALGASTTEAWLQLPKQSAHLSAGKRNNGLFKQQESGQPPCSTAENKGPISQRVEMRRGDDYLQPFITGYERVVIKIDCEGSESDVLDGCRNLFLNKPEVEFILLVEVLDAAHLSSIMKSIEDITIQARRQHQILIVNKGRFVDVTNKISQIILPQSMLMITL